MFPTTNHKTYKEIGMFGPLKLKKKKKYIKSEKLDGGHTILRLFKNCLKDAQRTKRQGKTKKTKSKYQ